MEKSSLSGTIKYAYYIEFGNYRAAESVDETFDPASISKLFYVTYLLKNYSLGELSEVSVPITLAQIRKYASGTRKLNYVDVGREISIQKLMEYMLIHSCNVSTGIVADLVGRREVNAFILQDLQLYNSTVYSSDTSNRTTVSDLIKLCKILTSDFLGEGKRELLFSLMHTTKRRAVIKQTLQSLPHFQVFSKGGTTYTGARRDLAIVKSKKGYGYIVVTQLPGRTPHFSLRSKLLAKLNTGPLSEYLYELAVVFRHEVKTLLEPILIIHSRRQPKL